MNRQYNIMPLKGLKQIINKYDKLSDIESGDYIDIHRQSPVIENIEELNEEIEKEQSLRDNAKSPSGLKHKRSMSMRPS